MARAIALRGCAAEANKLGRDGRRCGMRSISGRKKPGRRKQKPEAEQFAGEKNKSAGRPMQEKKRANLRLS